VTRVRKYVAYREEILSEAGEPADGKPLVKAAVAAVVANPTPGRYQADVTVNSGPSIEIGRELTRRLLDLVGDAGIASYGKGAIVGENGDQEQCVSFLTTAFGDTLRRAVDGTEWVSSVTKRGGQGAPIDIPLASKDFLQARAYYDAISITIPDAPRMDEIVLVIGAATRARLNERSGGLTIADKPS
jgi:Amino acid synthesis